MKMIDTRYRLLNVRFMLDYIKDPNPENWRTISGAKVHLTNGKIDGGAGGKFNGKVYIGKKSKIKPENSMGAAQSEREKAYNERIAAKKKRYKEMAEKAEQLELQFYNKGAEMMHAIPLGQPILVGHHSEKSDIAHRARMGRQFEKSHEQHEKAKYYAEKAEGYGTHGISGIDPAAQRKIQTEIDLKENAQEKFKAAGKAFRAGNKEEGLKLLFSAGKFHDKDIRYFTGQDPAYLAHVCKVSAQSNSAEIRRLKSRMNELEKVAANAGSVAESNPLYDLKQEDGRYQFKFEGKPSDEVRQILKSNGFKWSPSRGTWVRQATANAAYSLKKVKEQLKPHVDEMAIPF